MVALGSRELSGGDSTVVLHALNTLIWYGEVDVLDMEPFLDSGVRSGLGRNYQRLVASGKLRVGEGSKGTRAFEKQLGIR